MRKTLDLPIDLLNEAMKATHIKTKTKVIIIALEKVIRKSKIAELKKLKELKGRVDLDIDLNTIRGRQFSNGYPQNKDKKARNWLFGITARRLEDMEIIEYDENTYR